VNFEQGTVRAVDLGRKSVELETGPDRKGTRILKADHLVIALGSKPNYHHIPGVRKHSLGIKSVTEAAAIRSRVLGCLEAANSEGDVGARRTLLTFVVGGAGYTGVETMAAINDLARTATRDYPNIRPGEITTVIVEPGERLLSELSPDLAAFAQQKLEANGVEVRLNTKIAAAGDDYVELEGGERIATRTLVWAGGITPNPLVEKLDCRRGEHGGIIVDECCAVPDYKGIWALGDCAEVPKPGLKGSYSPTAQNATREGELVARNIVSVLRGDVPRPFRFEPIGELALVGRHSGVGKLYGHRFAGSIAWAMWRAVYLSKMPGMGQRSRILLDWVLDSVFGRNIAEVPVERSLDAKISPALK
jgi:NADH dehydrogenase